MSPVVYGDDNILNISDEISEYFNQLTLTTALKELGHTYTDETKTGEMVPYRLINEISFLKRTFVYDNDFCKWIAPLDDAVIYEMMNWVRKGCIDQRELLKDNIETALAEMSLHGRDKYDELVNSLIPLTDDLDIIYYTYEEVRLKVESFIMGDGIIA